MIPSVGASTRKLKTSMSGTQILNLHPERTHIGEAIFHRFPNCCGRVRHLRES